MSNFDDKLAQHISEISKEKQPERDLWRGIELGITSQQGDASQDDASQDDASSSTVTSKQWMAIAASVCLVTVLWFAAPFAFKADESRSDGYALIDAMSMQQQQQVNSLLASYESTTALTEDWQEQLKELDDAADVMSSYKKETTEEWHNNLMKKYRKIWKEKGCMHWRDDEHK